MTIDNWESVPETAAAAEQERGRRLAFPEHLFHTLPCGVMQFSDEQDPVVLSCNAACRAIYGYAEAEDPFTGRPFDVTARDGGKQLLREQFQHCRNARRPVDYMLPLAKKDGGGGQAYCVMALVENAWGRRVFQQICIDISKLADRLTGAAAGSAETIGREQPAAPEPSRPLAEEAAGGPDQPREDEIDPLTGLYHRHAFYRRVRQLLDAHPDRAYLLLRFDIDRFKAFNDMLGTKAGDQLLSAIGKTVLGLYGGHCVCGHIEADHFAGFLPADLASVEQNMARLGQWLQGYPAHFRLTCSAGVYRIDEPDLEVSLMCDRALLALMTVKKNYSPKLAFYDDRLRRELLEEQELISDMDQALKGGQFILYFQPLVNYESGALVGAEALVRWQHPRRGLLTPGKFIPLFEKNGFISALDEYVVEKSCACLRAWRDRCPEETQMSVAVNISRLDIYDPDFSGRLLRSLDRYGLPASCLKLEITESAYIENPEQLIQAVRHLQQLGFTVEMDDFGAGYSSLNILKDVPVDILKLDIRFLQQSGNNSRGGSILASVIRMARWLKLPIIAEGVETQRQADYLKNLGCVFMQGYYFARPMPAGEFEQVLAVQRTGRIDPYRHTHLEGMADFWDASSKTALLFNSLAGGAAILEYRENTLEAVCTNDSFYQTMGTTRGAYADLQTHILDRFDEPNRVLFVDMLETAIRTGRESECEVRSLPHPGQKDGYWTQNRARLLAESGGSYLFFVAVQDITERKLTELRLNKLLQIAVASRFEYICLLHTGTGQYELYADDGLDTHGLAARGDYGAAVRAIRDQHVEPAEREAYSRNAALAAVIQRMEENHGHYHYRYRLKDGPREAEFYYYEPTHQELLLTVRRLFGC